MQLITLSQGSTIAAITPLGDADGFYSHGMTACVTVILLSNFDSARKQFGAGVGLHCAGGIEVLISPGEEPDPGQKAMRTAFLQHARPAGGWARLIVTAGTDYQLGTRLSAFLDVAAELHREMAPWASKSFSVSGDIIALRSGATRRGISERDYLLEQDRFAWQLKREQKLADKKAG